MDLILIILSTYFLGRKVGEKGHDVYMWRFRHVMACIFIEILVGGISLMLTGDFYIASLSGAIAVVGLIVYRYQRVTQLIPKNNSEN